jgi:hypothetical protein
VRVSPDGGQAPVWQKDGNELFYFSLTFQEMAVDVKLGAEPKIGVPRKLFHAAWPAVTVDGQRFVTIENAADLPDVRVGVVLNWTAELGSK